jgi:signal transduction histidine kinase
MKYIFSFGLENAAWPAFLVDAQGLIRRASQGAASVFGAILESAYLSSVWTSDNEYPAEQFLARLARAPLPQVQLRLRTRGGAITPFTALISSLSQDGQKYFIFQFLAAEAGAATDRETKATEDKTQIAEALAQRQKLDCALQLTRTVALDFNNALTSVLVHTSHILDQMEPNNPWRNSLVEAEKAAQKAAEIANDLAAFSRQEKDTRAQQTGNINSLLRRTIDLFQRPGAGPSGLEWVTSFESRPYTVSFDEAKMQQAFAKILENSVQAIGSKGGRISVSSRNLDLREATHDQNARLAAGTYICVTIQDDGPGIPPEALPRVFEPFFTTKRGHRGLGLAWIYGIVTNHGGSVAISSYYGWGTSVRVYLPVATKKVVKDSLAPPQNLRGNETILIVDDEDLLLTMGQMVLSSFGYNVLTANCGEKALEIIQRSTDPIHLVITDLVMPRMGGRELIEHVRRIAPDTRIIYCSGFVRPTTEDEHAYLAKPFTSKGLLNKVRQILAAGE